MDVTWGLSHPVTAGMSRNQLLVHSVPELLEHTEHHNCILAKWWANIELLNSQLELINYFTYFSPSSHPKISYRPFVVNTTFSTPTRPVENFVITTKDLQERDIQMLEETSVENKGKTRN